MDVVDLPLEQIIPYARNPRRNEQAIATVAASIQEFGWRQPIVVDEAMVVLAGHTRLEAARKLGLTQPTLGRQVAALEKALGESEESKIIFKPQTRTEVDLDTAQKLMRLIDMLEEDDDVQSVTHNFDMSDEVAAQLG